jgi:hypothetical protein
MLPQIKRGEQRPQGTAGVCCRATIVHEQLQRPHRRNAPAPTPQALVTVGAHTEEGVIHAKQPSY